MIENYDIRNRYRQYKSNLLIAEKDEMCGSLVIVKKKHTREDYNVK